MSKNNDIMLIGGLLAVVGLGWCFLFGPCKRFIPGQAGNVEFDEAAAENKRRIAAGQPPMSNEEFAKRTPHAVPIPATPVTAKYAYYY